MDGCLDECGQHCRLPCPETEQVPDMPLIGQQLSTDGVAIIVPVTPG